MLLFLRLSCVLLIVGVLLPTPSRAASPLDSVASFASSALSASDQAPGTSFQDKGKKKGDDPKRPKPKPGPRGGDDDD